MMDSQCLQTIILHLRFLLCPFLHYRDASHGNLVFWYNGELTALAIHVHCSIDTYTHKTGTKCTQVREENKLAHHYIFLK